MKILLFGGTFDPPHAGHMNNLRGAIARVMPDRVVVMPAGTPPHKAASTTPGPVRMELCACFKPLFPGLEISDWEINRGGKSYTVETLRMLREKSSTAELFLSMGSDMLLSFTTWFCWQEILSLCTLVVESREEGDDGALEAAAAALGTEGGKILFTGVPPLVLSSTDIRTGRVAVDTLPPPVPELVRKYHLYGLTE